jgi:hypothetical protein
MTYGTDVARMQRVRLAAVSIAAGLLVAACTSGGDGGEQANLTADEAKSLAQEGRRWATGTG